LASSGFHCAAKANSKACLNMLEALLSLTSFACSCCETQPMKERKMKSQHHGTFAIDLTSKQPWNKTR